jgi:hypothetical protein
MLDDLDQPPDSITLPRVLQRLQSGPWAWPLKSEPTRFARAREVVPEGPPPVVPGRGLLVTVNDHGSSLWALSVDDLATTESSKALGRKAKEVWNIAAAALPRSLPLLWSSVAEARRGSLSAVRLITLPEAGHQAAEKNLLDGPSFGLSFVLVLASRVFQRPLPEDVVASGEIDASGRVHRVDGITEKVRVIRLAPRIRRLLVAKDNADEARWAAEGSALAILPVENAFQALKEAFGENEFASMLVHAGTDPVRRAELVDSFYRMALKGRGEVVDWTPVHEAAALALESWGNLIDDEERQRLKFAHAVALRHERNAGELPIPQDTWLGRLPTAVRVVVVANYVQQSADSGEPKAPAAELLAQDFLVPVEEAFPGHLKLRGALARLLALTGREKVALKLQQEAAQAFFNQISYSDVSFPLTEWYRLSGVCADKAAFGLAEAMRNKVDQLGGFGFDESDSRKYVDLARSKAMVMLGRRDGSDPEQTLAKLSQDADVPAHIRWSAARWYVQLLDQEHRSGDVAAITAALDAAMCTQHSGARDARLFRSLIDLDRAVRDNNLSAASAAVAVVGEMESGIIGHLLAHAPARSAAEYIARFYPY